MTSLALAFPYFRMGSIPLGPIDLQWFGILVATGVVFGVYMMRRWADAHGLEEDHIRGLVNWSLVCGFLGAHLFDVLAYQPHKLADDPLLLIKVWQGISSYGGFIGGTFGFFFYAMRHKLPLGRYADAGMWAFAPGFTFGRIGCTVVHDHIGAPAQDFFLATNYHAGVYLHHGLPAPGLYHNLGMYELFYMLFLCALMVGISRWQRRPDGFMVALIATTYAPVRFFLEFLRINPEADPRYFGLTFAQYSSIVLFLAGVYLVFRIVSRPRAPEAVAEPAGESKAQGDKAGKTANKAGAARGGKSKGKKRKK